MGSPAFALPTLRALIASRHEVVGVVTQPDRPAGRGRRATPPAAKLVALEQGLRVFQPDRVSAAASVEQLRALSADVIVIAAYGQILRQNVLDLPRRGSLNVHASLLPRHRGASPVVAAILGGDAITGVSIMEVALALDAGPVVVQVEEQISPHDTAGSLETRLAERGAVLLMETLDDWAEGRIEALPQDDSLATYAPIVKRQDALIDWSLTAVEIWRRVRAYNPRPVAYTTAGGTELRIWEAWPLAGDSGDPPGTLQPLERLPMEAKSEIDATFTVQTGRGRLALIRVQRSGSKILSGPEFLRGQRGHAGLVLGV